MTPHQPHAAGGVEALVAWWGGFVLGPLPAGMVLATSRDPLVRRHAAAAAAMWSAVIAVWVPISAASILFGAIPPELLLVVLPLLVVPAFAICVAATARLSKHPSAKGMAPAVVASQSDAKRARRNRVS